MGVNGCHMTNKTILELGDNQCGCIWRTNAKNTRPASGKGISLEHVALIENCSHTGEVGRRKI